MIGLSEVSIESLLPDDHQRGVELALFACIGTSFLRHKDALHYSGQPKDIDKICLEPNFEDTIEWFTKSPEFSAWKGNPDLALLWLHGVPGAGKTVLMSYVTKHLPQYFEYTKAWDAATLFCSSDYSEISMLISLSLQLSKDIVRAGAAWSNIKSWPTALTETQVSRHLWRLVEILIAAGGNSGSETIFLIDAIDELKPTTRAAFLKNLVALEKKASLSATTRILVSSRDYPDIREALSHYKSIERENERKGKKSHMNTLGNIYMHALIAGNRMSQLPFLRGMERPRDTHRVYGWRGLAFDS